MYFICYIVYGSGLGFTGVRKDFGEPKVSVRTLGVVFVVRGRLLFQGGTYVVGFSGPL